MSVGVRMSVGVPTNYAFRRTLWHVSLLDATLTICHNTKPRVWGFFCFCFGHGESAGNKAGVRVTAPLASLALWESRARRIDKVAVYYYPIIHIGKKEK